MDNPLKRITAVLCTTFLLSGCHSDIQQTQAKEDTTLQQETQEVSLQLQDEPLITEEFEGTLTFADTGDLQEEQKELINLYMKWYYDSLAKEEVEQVSAILEREMRQAAVLSVPLEVDMHTGENWYEAK